MLQAPGAEVLAETQLEGNCLGAPAICNGRVYVHTTEALYCWAGDGGPGEPPWRWRDRAESAGRWQGRCAWRPN